MKRNQPPSLCSTTAASSQRGHPRNRSRPSGSIPLSSSLTIPSSLALRRSRQPTDLPSSAIGDVQWSQDSRRVSTGASLCCSAHNGGRCGPTCFPTELEVRPRLTATLTNPHPGYLYWLEGSEKTTDFHFAPRSLTVPAEGSQHCATLSAYRLADGELEQQTTCLPRNPSAEYGPVSPEYDLASLSLNECPAPPSTENCSRDDEVCQAASEVLRDLWCDTNSFCRETPSSRPCCYSVVAVPELCRAAIAACQGSVAHFTRMGNARTPAKTSNSPRISEGSVL